MKRPRSRTRTARSTTRPKGGKAAAPPGFTPRERRAMLRDYSAPDDPGSWPLLATLRDWLASLETPV